MLDAHVRPHQDEELKCEICPKTFLTNAELDMHFKTEHQDKKLQEWNCNDCCFQSTDATQLMNHLKLTTHQPSPTISDKKKLFSYYKRCYTCNLEVDGYLMNHRKEIHPSNKEMSQVS